MSEEIMINDINVCDCNAYKDKHCKNETSIMFTEYNLCSNFPNCYYKQLKRLQKTLKHTENGKKVKAEKLKRIEEIVIHCIQGGFTDEFVQEIFDICREYEEV